MINKSELIKGTVSFLEKYNRLPYMAADDIYVEKTNKDGKKVMRAYRSNKYIDELFGDQDKFTKHLMDSGVITYETIAKSIKLNPDRVSDLLNKKAKRVSRRERRAIDIFFNKDFYSNLGKYSGVNRTCRNNCKFPYWVMVDYCSIHSPRKK